MCPNYSVLKKKPKQLLEADAVFRDDEEQMHGNATGGSYLAQASRARSPVSPLYLCRSTLPL